MPLLIAIPAGAQDSPFHFKQLDDKSLGLWEGERPVLVYNFGEKTLPKVRSAAPRSSYLHPIYGLDGEVLTDDFPADHYHHHGLFWGWPHVQIGDREYDLWKMRGIRIDFRRWLAKDLTPDNTTNPSINPLPLGEGRVRGSKQVHSPQPSPTGRGSLRGAKLGIENRWVVRNRDVMKEEVWLDIHPATAGARSIDVALSWTPIDEPITLGGAEGKSYGGLTLRFAPRTETVITVPDGRAKEDLLIARLPWADLSAKFRGNENKGAVSGAALFVDPRHPDFPPEWMTREYGVLAIGWPGVSPQTLPPGKTVTCRYRLWIHRGAPEAAEIQAAYNEYVAAIKQ